MAANIPSPFYKTSSASGVATAIKVYNAAALTAAQALYTFVAGFRCEIGSITAYAGTAGTGGASTVLDVLVSHVNLTTGVYDTPTSIWATAANRPTMLAVNTGLFSVARPDFVSGTSYRLALKPGDIVQVTCPTISSTGHALVAVTINLSLRG